MRYTLALMLALVLTSPLPAHAQLRKFAPVLGGGAGVASGGFLVLSYVVAQSRRGHYLHDPKDLFGWQSAPVLIGGGTGLALGILDPDRLLRTVIGGTAGTLLGMGVGGFVGRAIWLPPEGKWAGAAIGSGLGLMAGCVIGILWPAPSNDDATASARHAGVPIAISLHF